MPPPSSRGRVLVECSRPRPRPASRAPRSATAQCDADLLVLGPGLARDDVIARDQDADRRGQDGDGDMKLFDALLSAWLGGRCAGEVHHSAASTTSAASANKYREIALEDAQRRLQAAGGGAGEAPWTLPTAWGGPWGGSEEPHSPPSDLDEDAEHFPDFNKELFGARKL